MPGSEPERPLVVHVGRKELVVRRRYEALSIANDTLIALWFIAGSIMFFSSAWMTTGTWCFLLGSVELLIRPVIRLTRLIHVRSIRASGGHSTEPPDSSADF
ncbi:YrhK family protein [Nocardiopsis sp. NPDC058631]|uniref:YrhK family protein n=1 Tax=Nocardiopsis sp. NPDC058631 TaxID=3346566 RepID=UPI003664E980